MPDGQGLRRVLDAGRPSLLTQARWLWDHRDLIGVLGRRDISVRYRQTGLGVTWVLLQPLLGAVLFAFVFERIAHVTVSSGDYFTFALTGLAVWTFFVAVTMRSSMSLLSNIPLLTKAAFPRLVLPVATLPSALVDLVVALVLAVVFVVARGRAPSLDLLYLLPAALLPVAGLGLGLGLLFSALSVQFRDVQQVVPVALQLGLYASPVAYPASSVPAAFSTAYHANPLVGSLSCARAGLLGGPLDLPALAYSWAVASVVLLVGALVFVRREETFADVV